MQKGRRGVTLMELCIVIALVAILSTMVVSFSVLTNRRSRAAEARLSAMQEIAEIEVVVEAWFGRMNIGIAEAAPSEDKKSLTCVGGVLWFEDSRLTGTVTGESGYSLPVEYVTGVEFSQSGEVYFCRVMYEVSGEGESITFCVNPRVGETVGS